MRFPFRQRSVFRSPGGEWNPAWMMPELALLVPKDRLKMVAGQALSDGGAGDSGPDYGDIITFHAQSMNQW